MSTPARVFMYLVLDTRPKWPVVLGTFIDEDPDHATRVASNFPGLSCKLLYEESAETFEAAMVAIHEGLPRWEQDLLMPLDAVLRRAGIGSWRAAPDPPPPPTVTLQYDDAARLFSSIVQGNQHVRELQTRLTEELFARRRWDRQTQVSEFFVIAGQHRATFPKVPDDAIVRFRLRLIAEEFIELIEAALGKPSPTDRDAWHGWNHLGDLLAYIETGPIYLELPEFTKELADLDYVVEGARCAFGIDGNPIAAAVHASNMAKAGGPRRESDGKMMKPPGWVKPDIAGLLVEQGWSERRGFTLSEHVRADFDE